ncbi:MAG: alpha/beta hydrolase [Planctomycetota bacterium]
MRLIRVIISFLASLAVLAVDGGCSHASTLEETPYIMVGEAGVRVYDEVKPSLRTSDIPVLFFTDRLNEQADPDGPPVYGRDRSDGAQFGRATIELSPELTWEELVADSTSPSRQRIEMTMGEVEILGEFAPIRDRLVVESGRLVYPSESSAGLARDLADFDAAIEPWLEPGNDNAAIVYVHGVYTPFDRSVFRLADAWHAAGRDGVPIVFSWPTGRKGLLPFAYAHDQESGDFSVRDLKLLLTALARNERIARVHLIAWSRGNEVATTAVRELNEEILASRGQTWMAQIARSYDETERVETLDRLRGVAEVLKLDTLMLIAADIDLGVFEERVFAERVVHAANRVVVYTSLTDKALDIADLFAQSGARLGQARAENMDPTIVRLIADLPSLEMIECRVPSDDVHGYVFEHPGALSDMIRIIRDDAPIGEEHGRPL